jgi:hypothetical protein
MRELKGDWRDLFNGFMLALDLRKMFLGFAGLLLSLGAVLLFLLLCDRYDSEILRDPSTLRPAPRATYTSRLERTLLPKSVNTADPQDLSCRNIRMSVASTVRHLGKSPWQAKVLIPLGVFLILATIWSYFGGAIARIAAVEVAKDERIETQRALQYAGRKYSAFFWAPLVCLIFFSLFAACNAAGGLVGWAVDWVVPGLGDVALAVFLPFALLSGFLMALIVIGSVFGGPLFQPAIGAEGTDCFDAISRGFSYIYSRPWHYGIYQAVAAVYGAVCVGFVWWFGAFMVRLGLGAGRVGMAVFGSTADFDRLLPEPVTRFLFHSGAGYSGFPVTTSAGRTMEVIPDSFWSLGPLQMLASIVLLVWIVVIAGMLAGYAVSYLFSSQTLVYFLLRKKVDGIEMNEVFEEKEEGEEDVAEGATEGAAPAPEGGESQPAGVGGGGTPPAPEGGAPPAQA